MEEKEGLDKYFTDEMKKERKEAEEEIAELLAPRVLLVSPEVHRLNTLLGIIDCIQERAYKAKEKYENKRLKEMVDGAFFRKGVLDDE